MKWKKSYTTEILIVSISFLVGVYFSAGGLLFYLGGIFLIFVVSYFLVSKLKEQTIMEYLEKKEEIKNENKNS